MRTFCLLVSAVLAVSCKNTKPAVATDNSDPTKYLNTITAAELKQHMLVIASDEMEGRETGSIGQKKAGTYLIEQYKKDRIRQPKGAKDYYQHVPAEFMNGKYGQTLPDSENIWAFIEGSVHPEEIVVLSAHYDHVGMKNGQVYNGADDDGSGTVTLLEIAQALQIAKKEGRGPKRSVLILHVTGEEHGLHGSRYYSENPIFPLANTIANVNIDMIGRHDPEHEDSSDYMYSIGSNRLSSQLQQIIEDVNQKYTQLKIEYRYDAPDDPNRFYFRSDHYNFAKNGIPSVFFFSGIHADYHQPGDDADKIEYDALAKRAKLAFATIWELANRNERIVVDKK
ncbi:M28 family metallopeptidase [Flavobacterium caeni]|uniref:Peptidase family M28 n=1 Tax=Flavobacterium caeni TaxID=490189 RepID=A0A1G5CGY6_9FLAO|nr:M28 family metallopeptidase [Flavobacterium caeni]SCY01574.1 Peptidase family M28 [Flavobacterium caeni]